MPGWVTAGFEEYRRRLPAQMALELHEVPAGQRKARSDAAAARRLEGDQLLRRADRADLVLALDEQGRQWNTAELAEALRRWQLETPRVALLVGGPDGLDERCRQRADRLWSLSTLTLPHALVRVLIAEQIYRAWTILKGHPYHRA